MKSLTLALLAAVFGFALLIPAHQARAQDWSDEDMENDAYAIQRRQQQLHHDYRELQGDLATGQYGEAAEEQREIERRRGDLQRRQQDLSNDYANRYYSEDGNPYGYYGHHRDWDEDEDED